MDKSSKIKSVLITGCSSGIGLCIAHGLQSGGYRVFASARKQSDVEELKKLGFDSLLLDLSSSSSINSAISKLFDQTDNLFALINNGAYGQAGALEDISREALEKQFQVNVFGWHELTNLVLPLMRKVNKGRIIYISSVLGFVAMPFRGPYVASKFAIENAFLAFKENVDITNSSHKEQYKIMIRRLNSDKNAKYTLPAEAVLKATIHALESNSPKIHYRVTFPTKLFAFLGRILPSSWLDFILNKV